MRGRNVASINLAEVARLIESDPAAAAEKAREAVAANASDPVAYRLLGASLRQLGEDDEANAAELKAIELSGNDPDMLNAGQAMGARDYRTAEGILRTVLQKRPNDVVAIQMLGEIAAAAGMLENAEELHRRAAVLAPGFQVARLHLANVLNNQGRPAEALAELQGITGEMLDFVGYKMLLGDLLSQVGDIDEAIGLYRGILETTPNKPEVWSRLAFLLNSVGKQDEAIEVTRAAMKAVGPSGRTWWSLADLKTYRFTDEDIAEVERALADPSRGEEDRLHLHFALGKALEDRKDYRASFDQYRRGNDLRKARMKYQANWGEALLQRVSEVLTPEFLQARAGEGDPSPDPIFIVGMPRSGSTLVEQILASHPLIEGTAELPDLNALAFSLQTDPRAGPRSIAYLDRLRALSPEDMRALGGLYLDRTRIQRRTDRPFFLDKMPSNWAHVGFIKLILPNAKIIDVRRNPLACGFSNYKQLFGRGQEFAYDLADIGHYYRDYVAVMAHFDEVAPGAVHRVIYERLVQDSETEIRALLAYLGVPFDEACVRFYETDRAVRTPSSDQVRQPLRPELVNHWKAFESDLAPLREALGPALNHWDDPQP